MATKEAFLVIPELGENHCIREAFNKIADALHEYAGAGKSYVYNEIQLNKKGGMLITLVLNNGNHRGELITILNNANEKSEGSFESIKIFAFEDLLNKEGHKVDADKIANAQKIAIKASKKAFFVILVPKENYHICEAFDKIAEALHEYTDTDKSYVYDEMRVDGKGAMVISLTLKGNHKSELRSVLENAKGKSGENIESFKVFALSELLNKKAAKGEIW